MGRLKGEAGASPALTRNCEDGYPSQVARLKRIYHEPRGKEVGYGISSLTPARFGRGRIF